MNRRFKFNRCIHWEKEGKGRYFGFHDPLFDLAVLFWPWIRDDGDKGFIEFLIFRFGWYPVPSKNKNELAAYDRTLLEKELAK